jgi:hypothetical protein
MVDKAAVVAAIKASPVEAKEALLAVQAGQSDPLTMAGIEAAASFKHAKTEDLAADQLEQRGLLRSFVLAMNGLGVPLDADDAGNRGRKFQL